MTQHSLGLSKEPDEMRTVPSRSPARGLVFVGFRIEWRRRIGDLELNTRLAEAWESAFDHWAIEGRKVHLGHGGAGYSLYLSDGSARFVVHTPKIVLRQAQEHVQELIKALKGAGRNRIVIHTEAQYLEPVPNTDFATLMHSMVRKVLNPDFGARLGATFKDLAYTVDLDIEGQWFQVRAGPVRAHEVAKWVASPAHRLGKIPELAYFSSVNSHAKVDAPDFEFDSFWQRVSRLGISIIQELTDDRSGTELGG